MTMKTILAIVDDSDGLPSVLESALLVARRFGSYVEGMHVQPVQPAVVSDGFAFATPDLLEGFERQAKDHTERAHARFEAFMREREVPRGTFAQPTNQPVARWMELTSVREDAIGSHGRLFDLIIVERPAGGASVVAMSTLESVLFDSGRPLLIAPPAPPTSLGESVVVTWNGSTETARTIAFAMPFLVRAKQVVVLSVTEGMVAGPSGGEVAQHLISNGIAAQPTEVAAGGRSIGEAILEEAAGLGADLLIKGAYTHSRLRQMIFGGATSHILAAAELPVFMAH
jgi:nucleotide-binding universal stress UspA family protein